MLQQQRFTPQLPVSGFLTLKLGWPALSGEGYAQDVWSEPQSPFLATTAINHAMLPMVWVGAQREK